MALSRARFLQSDLTTVHDASDVSQFMNMASLARVSESHLFNGARSTGLIFHCFKGCALRQRPRPERRPDSFRRQDRRRAGLFAGARQRQ